MGCLDLGTGQGSLFRKLVSSVASSSWLVEELLLTADTLALERSSDIKVHECLAKRRSPVATVMRAIAIGWLFDTASAYQEYGFACDKEDWYAGAFMWKLIFALRHGASKKEAFITAQPSNANTLLRTIVAVSAFS